MHGIAFDKELDLDVTGLILPHDPFFKGPTCMHLV